VSELTVASFNVHCGVDGWGRAYDVEAACRLLDADVLVLQESWTPDDGPGVAELIGAALGYDVITRPLALGWLFQPSAEDQAPAGSSWQPTAWTRMRHRRGRIRRGRFQRGTRDLSVLTRVPVSRSAILDLGQLRLDPLRREAVALTLDLQAATGGPITVVGTHMSHLTDGSPVQYRRLAAQLPRDDVVVLGDMNLPGVLLRATLPGWRRVVRGRTWPSWRPVVQSDCILASAGLAEHARGEVVAPVRGSDHLPVRARFPVAVST
jgi:endonuclease/exonuclease/phosphatase family metal-dependent hydrolase